MQMEGLVSPLSLGRSGLLPSTKVMDLVAAQIGDKG